MPLTNVLFFDISEATEALELSKTRAGELILLLKELGLQDRKVIHKKQELISAWMDFTLCTYE